MMPSQATLFYPHHLDLWNPIHTIHREISRELSETYRIVGFSDGTKLAIDNVRLKQIPRNGTKLRKALSYLVSYSGRYDIVHTGPSPRHRFATLAKLRGASLVHTLHSAPSDTDTRDRQQTLSHQADIVTAVSPYVAAWAKSELDIENVTVVPNGVDIDHFSPDRAVTEQQTLLFVGRSIPRKHPELPVELARKLPNYTVRMRGVRASDVDGPVPSNVEFLDHLSNDELADLYARSQCLLCPFEREGFGMVAIEAMAAGTPVIGLDHGNLPDLITDRNGTLCDTVTASTWVDAVERVNSSCNTFTPRTTVKKYDWSEIATKYDDIYKHLLASNRL